MFLLLISPLRKKRALHFLGLINYKEKPRGAC